MTASTIATRIGIGCMVLANAMPLIAEAAAPRTFTDLSNLMITLISSTTFVLMLAGLAIYFWGVSSNMIKISKGEGETLKNQFVWGIMVLFIMFSIWGIVQILQNTLFSDSIGNTSAGSTKGLCNTFGAPGCGQ